MVMKFFAVNSGIRTFYIHDCICRTRTQSNGIEQNFEEFELTEGITFSVHELNVSNYFPAELPLTCFASDKELLYTKVDFSKKTSKQQSTDSTSSNSKNLSKTTSSDVTGNNNNNDVKPVVPEKSDFLKLESEPLLQNPESTREAYNEEEPIYDPTPFDDPQERSEGAEVVSGVVVREQQVPAVDELRRCRIGEMRASKDLPPLPDDASDTSSESSVDVTTSGFDEQSTNHNAASSLPQQESTDNVVHNTDRNQEVVEYLSPQCHNHTPMGPNWRPHHPYDPVYVPTTSANAMNRRVDSTGYVSSPGQRPDFSVYEDIDYDQVSPTPVRPRLTMGATASGGQPPLLLSGKT